MPKELTALFCPSSVAVVGASRNPQKIGAIVLRNILDSQFEGNVYPINPNTEDIDDLKCYKDFQSLPKTPDLAVIAVPNKIVIDVLGQAGEKGTKNFVIFSAGFKEAGEEGQRLEKKLIDIASKYEMNILGPNCLGFVNEQCPINATFAQVSREKGNLRFISQSGAIASSLFDWSTSTSLGFSEFITLGNKADINENDILEHFLKSQNTITSLVEEGAAEVEPIGMYLESIADGPEFIKLTKKIAQRNPIFLLKPGKSEAAASAMQSHTGAIAGADDVLEAALKQAGVLRCNSLQDFFDVSKAFSWEEIPTGPRVAVISNAGGPAVISADAIVKEGLEVAEFDQPIKERLSEVLPRAAAILDPVDIMGDALPKRYEDAMDIILQTNACDSLVVILTPQMVTQVEETAEIIGKMSKKHKKPIFCSFMGGNLVSEGIKILDKHKIPSFNYPERAISAIGAMWRFKQNQNRIIHEVQDISVLNKEMLPEDVSQIIKDAIDDNRTILDNIEANKIITAANINSPQTKLVKDLSEAKFFAENVGYPVVLKLSSPGLVHKKDVGGVILEIKNQKELDNAWDTLVRKTEFLDEKIKENVAFQIQKEVVSDVEVIIGVKHDPTFGPVLLFGAGGSYAEMLADKNLHLLPVDINAAKKLVQESKVYTLLKGTENRPDHALDKLYEVIVKLGKLVREAPEIKEIEINPVIVTLNDVWAVDPKVFLQPKKKKPAGPKFKTATTLSTKLLAGKTRYFEMELEEPIDFIPGQYISVKVSNTRINCYSIAGQSDPKHFNLLVDSTPGGPGSKFFESLKEGDKVPFLGPFGTFKLNTEDGAQNLLFLGTGCGLAPLKYMVESVLENEDNKDKKVSLYMGVATYENIFLKEHFKKLMDKHSNFDFKIAVEKPCNEWEGYVGYINKLVEDDYPDASKCSAYLCGNKFMIEDATKLLINNGCPPERIYTEKI